MYRCYNNSGYKSAIREYASSSFVMKSHSDITKFERLYIYIFPGSVNSVHALYYEIQDARQWA